jgi:glycine cleavage system H protein
MTERTIRGFTVRTDLAYDLTAHLWIDAAEPERVRIGMDPLGVETSGTLAQLAFVNAGTELRRGDQFGSLEAEKFVGSLSSPLSGTVLAGNDRAVGNPALTQHDPYGDGWFIEVAPSDLDEDLASLLTGPEEIAAAFEEKIAEYRIQGVLAE